MDADLNALVEQFYNPPKNPHAIEQCNFCSKRVDDKHELKVCGGCRLVKYCSRECQRAAWPRHRRTCSTLTDTRQNLAQPGRQDDKAHHDAISKWVALWGRTLLLSGIQGMNLVDHPERLVTHVMFLEMELRDPLPPEKARALKMLSGSILPRASVLESMAGTLPNINLEPLRPLTTDPNALQVVMRIYHTPSHPSSLHSTPPRREKINAPTNFTPPPGFLSQASNSLAGPLPGRILLAHQPIRGFKVGIDAASLQLMRSTTPPELARALARTWDSTLMQWIEKGLVDTSAGAGPAGPSDALLQHPRSHSAVGG